MESSEKQRAFLVRQGDNVAVALQDLVPGPVSITGDTRPFFLRGTQNVPQGHKISVVSIPCGQPVVKYHVTIGRATVPIEEGSWVHLHNMESLYDERSNKDIDSATGLPKDIPYA